MIYILFTSLLFTSIYLLSWIKFHKYQFLERDYNIVVKNKEYSKKWHSWKAVNQGIFFFFIFILFGVKILTVNIVFYWVFFDGFLNITVLNKPFFFVGTTAATDIRLTKIAKFLRLSPSNLAAILKIILIITSIIFLF
jgi:hypothetical protein